MIDVNNIIPKWDMVLVKIVNSEKYIDNLILPNNSDAEDIAIRYGEVISFGNNATNIDHCPNLSIKDVVIFTEFAGYYVITADNENLYKVIRAYDIIGKKMYKDTIIPTGNRILIETIDFTNNKEGIIFNAKDPKLADLCYGKILKVNNLINKLNLSEGQLVVFAPYVGTVIRHYESDEKPELKIIVEEDVLFTV